MKHALRSIWLFAVLVLTSLSASGQFGPGGVGASDNSTEGQPELLLWLRAEDLSADGQPVSTWYDLSGNGHDAVKGGSEGPVFRASGLKGRPCVEFDGSSWFRVSEQSNLDGGPGIAIFVVLQPTAIDNGSGMKLITKRNHWNLWGGGLSKETCQYSFNLDFHGKDESQYLMAHVNGNLPANKVETAPEFHNLDTLLLVNYNYTGSYAAIRTNGHLSVGAKPNPNMNVGDVGPLEDYENDVSIGAAKYEPQLEGDPGPVADFLQAKVGEIILYRTGLDSTRLFIIENYLALKYGLDLGTDQLYSDPVYTHHLLGLGSLNGKDIHREASNGIILVNDLESTIDAAGEFLWVADDGAEVEWTGEDVPESWDSRWSRVYKITKKGEMDISLTFNFVEAGVTLNREKDYSLLYRESEAAGFIPTDLEGKIKFGRLIFELSDEQLATGYYTIAEKEGTSGIHELRKEQYFQVTPNPVEEHIILLNPGMRIVKRLQIMDMSGRIIQTIHPGNHPEPHLILPVTPFLSAGIYLLHIESELTEEVHRFVYTNHKP